MNEIDEDNRKDKREKKRSKLGKILSRRVFALGFGLWFFRDGADYLGGGRGYAELGGGGGRRTDAKC